MLKEIRAIFSKTLNALILSNQIFLNGKFLLIAESISLIPSSVKSDTLTCSPDVTSPNIRKGIIKVTFPSPLQYLPLFPNL